MSEAAEETGQERSCAACHRTGTALAATADLCVDAGPCIEELRARYPIADVTGDPNPYLLAAGDKGGRMSGGPPAVTAEETGRCIGCRHPSGSRCGGCGALVADGWDGSLAATPAPAVTAEKPVARMDFRPHRPVLDPEDYANEDSDVRSGP